MSNEHIIFIFKTHSEVMTLFKTGQVNATRGALDLLDRAGANASNLLRRHQCGDWGDVCPDDAESNKHSLQYGGRLLSAYKLGAEHEPLWIITEYDHSATTLLLPEEY